MFRKLNLGFWDLFGRKHGIKHENRSIKQVNWFFRSASNLWILEMKDWYGMIKGTIKTFLAFLVQHVIEIAQPYIYIYIYISYFYLPIFTVSICTGASFIILCSLSKFPIRFIKIKSLFSNPFFYLLCQAVSLTFFKPLWNLNLMGIKLQNHWMGLL